MARLTARAARRQNPIASGILAGGRLGLSEWCSCFTKSLLIEITEVLFPASPCSVAPSRTCHGARLRLNKMLVGKMIKHLGSIRAYLEASISPFRSAKKRFRLPPRRPLKGCPSLSAPACGRRFRRILATLIRRRFLTSAWLQLRDQPNNADHQQQRPSRHKPRQGEKKNEDSEAIHGWEAFFCSFPRFLFLRRMPIESS